MKCRMDDPDDGIRKIHRDAYRELREKLSNKVPIPLIKTFANLLPTNRVMLAQISSNFRRARADASKITQICRSAYIKKVRLYKTNQLQDAQTMAFSSSESEYLSESTDDEPLM